MFYLTRSHSIKPLVLAAMHVLILTGTISAAGGRVAILDKRQLSELLHSSLRLTASDPWAPSALECLRTSKNPLYKIYDNALYRILAHPEAMAASKESLVRSIGEEHFDHLLHVSEMLHDPEQLFDPPSTKVPPEGPPVLHLLNYDWAVHVQQLKGELKRLNTLSKDSENAISNFERLFNGARHPVESAEDSTEQLAAPFFQRFVDQKNPTAQYQLGLMHLRGRGVPMDEKQGEKLLLGAVDGGHIEAKASLGSMYYLGMKGIPKNPKKGISLIKSVAKHGSTEAAYVLGILYERGVLESNLSEDNAGYWFLQAAVAQPGHPDAQFRLGRIHENDGNIGEATKWYGFAADQGHALALTSLGRLYSMGLEIEQNIPAAIRFLESAGKQGLLEAQFNLAYLYEMLGDEPNALKWYRAARKQGSEAADRKIKYLTARWN